MYLCQYGMVVPVLRDEYATPPTNQSVFLIGAIRLSPIRYDLSTRVQTALGLIDPHVAEV